MCAIIYLVLLKILLYAIDPPGHATTLQPSKLLLEPTQSAPPSCGAGFVQVRVRVRVPAPQVCVQLLQDNHWVQLPSTVCNMMKHKTVHKEYLIMPTSCSSHWSVTISTSKSLITWAPVQIIADLYVIRIKSGSLHVYSYAILCQWCVYNKSIVVFHPLL